MTKHYRGLDCSSHNSCWYDPNIPYSLSYKLLLAIQVSLYLYVAVHCASVCVCGRNNTIAESLITLGLVCAYEGIVVNSPNILILKHRFTGS